MPLEWRSRNHPREKARRRGDRALPREERGALLTAARRACAPRSEAALKISFELGSLRSCVTQMFSSRLSVPSHTRSLSNLLWTDSLLNVLHSRTHGTQTLSVLSRDSPLRTLLRLGGTGGLHGRGYFGYGGVIFGDSPGLGTFRHPIPPLRCRGLAIQSLQSSRVLVFLIR